MKEEVASLLGGEEKLFVSNEAKSLPGKPSPSLSGEGSNGLSLVEPSQQSPNTKSQPTDQSRGEGVTKFTIRLPRRPSTKVMTAAAVVQPEANMSVPIKDTSKAGESEKAVNGTTDTAGAVDDVLFNQFINFDQEISPPLPLAEEIKTTSTPERWIGRFTYIRGQPIPLDQSVVTVGSRFDVEIDKRWLQIDNNSLVWGGADGIYTADSDICKVLLQAHPAIVEEAKGTTILAHFEIVPTPKLFSPTDRPESHQWRNPNWPTLAMRLLGWELRSGPRAKRKPSFPVRAVDGLHLSHGMVFSNLTKTAMTAYHSSPLELESIGRWERGDWLLMEGSERGPEETAVTDSTAINQYILHLDDPVSRKGLGRKRRRLFSLARLCRRTEEQQQSVRDESNNPFAASDTKVIYDNLAWEDLKWKHGGLAVRDLFVAIRSFAWIAAEEEKLY